MTSLVIFDFRGAQVRTLGTLERPLFRAEDVCAILDLGNVAQACGRLDQDEAELIVDPAKFSHESVGPGTGTRAYKVLYVTESGLYSLIFQSRKEEAKAFKKWLTSEVLPALRRQGHYSVPGAAPAPALPASPASEALIRHRGVVELVLMAGDILAPAYRERVVVHSLALLQGSAPAAATDPLIDVSDYLASRGLGAGDVRKHASVFGKKVKAFYEQKHGRPPQQLQRFINGKERFVYCYTERDRKLFDAAFDSVVKPKLGGGNVIPITGAG